MKLAIMQPYFLPYIGYFQLIQAVDKFVIYDDVNFINRGWINRNNLLIGGNKQLFTIPLVDASQNKLINEIAIVGEYQWKLKLLKKVEHAYRKAPFFEPIYALFCGLMNAGMHKIADLNVLAIRKICEYLEIKTEIVPTSELFNNRHLKSQHRILDICIQEKIDTYINPIGGMELYDQHLFREHHIEIYFIKSIEVPYPHITGKYLPWLSVLDVLMHVHKSELQAHLNNFQLIQQKNEPERNLKGSICAER